MLENPCFIISLQTGAKIIAVLDIILAAIPLAIILSGVIPGYKESKNLVDALEHSVTDGVESTTRIGTNLSVVNVIVQENRPYFDMGIWTIMIFFVVIDITVSYILFSASKKRHLKRLKMWFYIRSVTLVLTIIILISSMCLGITFRFVVYDCFHTIYRMYTLWVIHAFIQEILMENRRLQNGTYYSQTFGRTPPSIIVTAAPPAGENDSSNPTTNNVNSNGHSKFAFDNIAFS